MVSIHLQTLSECMQKLKYKHRLREHMTAVKASSKEFIVVLHCHSTLTYKSTLRQLIHNANNGIQETLTAVLALEATFCGAVLN